MMKAWYFGFWEEKNFFVPVNYYGILVNGEEANRILYHLCKNTGKDYVLKTQEQIQELSNQVKIEEWEGK